MAYTQADLDALNAEIAKVGVVESTSFGDQSTKFRPLADLLKLRAVMTNEINGAGSRTRYAATSKGV